MAVNDYEPDIEAAAAKYGVDPRIIRTTMKIESDGNPHARSSAGAEGLMQLMPATARALGVKDPSDPAQNIGGGTSLYAENLARFNNDPLKAALAFHSGPKAVETRRVGPAGAQYQTKWLNEFKAEGGTLPPGSAPLPQTLPGHAVMKNGKPLDMSHAVTGFNASEYEDLLRIAYNDPMVKAADRAVGDEIKANNRAAEVVEKNLPEYGKLRERMREAGKLPDEPNFQDLPGEKQVEIRDPMKALFQFMPMLALLGGAANKKFSLAAMDAATGAMNAQKAGDYAKREEEHQKWLDNTKRVVEGNALMLNRYEIAMGRRKAGLDEIKAEMEAIASENGDLVMLANLQKGNLESIYKGMEVHAKALDPVAKVYAAALAAVGKGKAYSTSSGVPLTYSNGQFSVAAGPNAGQPYDPARDGEIQSISARPRNTGMALLQSARAEYAAKHGGAEMPVAAQKEFLINFSAQSKAMAKATSGKWQDNIIAANTALQHLDVLQEAAANLNTGDVVAINNFVQTVATEFGRPEAVDFNSAKEVVADELIKAVIGTGGGVTDRVAAKDKLKASMSPEQMAGVVAVQKGLLAGRLDSMHRAYVETTGANDFARYLSPGAADAMMAAGKDPNAPPETGLHSPDAAPQTDHPSGGWRPVTNDEFAKLHAQQHAGYLNGKRIVWWDEQWKFADTGQPVQP